MRDTKGYFNKLSADLDSALQKNAAASKSRPAEVEDATNLLTATQSCFRYTALDYVFQISMIQAKKRHDVLEAILAPVLVYQEFFKNGKAMFNKSVGTESSAAVPQTKPDDLGTFTTHLGREIKRLKVCFFAFSLVLEFTGAPCFYRKSLPLWRDG